MAQDSFPERLPRKRGRKTNIEITGKDIDLIAWGSSYLGCTKAEFMRTAIRVYVRDLERLSEKLGDA